MKKTITLLLVLLMSVSMAACGGTASSPPAETEAPSTAAAVPATAKPAAEAVTDAGDPYAAQYPITGNIVYFKDTLNWATDTNIVYVYYWSADSDKMVQWPGARMKSLGDNVYSFDVPKEAEFLIFDINTDAMSKQYQTRDIPYDGSVRRFQCSDKQDEMKARYVTDWDGKEIGTNQIDDGSGANQLIVNDIELASIEKRDTFPVKFTSYNFTGSKNITFSFNVQNGTDKTISKITCFVLAYNDSIHARIIDIGTAVDLGLGDDAYIQEYTYDNLKLAAGAATQLKLDAEQKTISDFRAIVSSYTADGKEVKNPTAYEWYKNAYKNKVVDNGAIYDKLMAGMGASEGANLLSKDDRGAVTLDATVLFDYDSAKVSDKGKASLKKLIDAYADTISTDDGTVLIKKITVEGHTDTDGDHAYNQKLSLERAQNVLDYCVSLHPELKSIMSAKGCADDNPVKKADGSVDMAASRRVCFVAE